MRSGLLLAAVLLLGACGDRQATKDGVRPTGLPGVVTAGGRTSGAVIAAAAPGAPVNPGPAGTPGIPQGSEGNTGGAALGSSVPKNTNIAAAANTAAAPASAAIAPAGAALSPASAAAIEAQQSQATLERAQDAVAAAWRARAATQGFTRSPAAPPADIVVKSEKLGTAAPSTDVKQPTEPTTRPVAERRGPDAASPKP